jgi:hypothetical protein
VLIQYIMDLDKQNVVHVSSRCANHKFNIFLSHDNLEPGVDLKYGFLTVFQIMKHACKF